MPSPKSMVGGELGAKSIRPHGAAIELEKETVLVLTNPH
jgi:hypothetical protein